MAKEDFQIVPSDLQLYNFNIIVPRERFTQPEWRAFVEGMKRSLNRKTFGEKVSYFDKTVKTTTRTLECWIIGATEKQAKDSLRVKVIVQMKNATPPNRRETVTEETRKKGSYLSMMFNNKIQAETFAKNQAKISIGYAEVHGNEVRIYNYDH